MKLIWQTPKLIVLTRSNPEEAVLEACKLPSVHSGPGNPNCKSPSTGGTQVICYDQVPS